MKLPKVVMIRRRFPRPRVKDIEGRVRSECMKEGVASRVAPGASVAITVGSRGIADIGEIVRSLVGALEELGAKPFIVPAMGSHGGATAEGQEDVLRRYGVTEEKCGAPVRSSMETVKMGETASGVAVYMDRLASEADGVVLVGRIKPHTDFRSHIESGLMKMTAIGLGKHAQALALHAHGIKGIRDYMLEASTEVIRSGKILFGVGIVENAYEETAILEAIPSEEIPSREAELLEEASRLLPRLPVDDLDVLFVDRLGKDYSGTGMDTNVIGRFGILGVEDPERPRIKYIVVGDLSERSHGNALGIGLADFTTERLAEKIDRRVTNENVLTSTFVERAKIPMVMENDREAIEAALRCNWGVAPKDARFARIANTLNLEYVCLSENLVKEALSSGEAQPISGPEELSFDEKGHLCKPSQDSRG